MNYILPIIQGIIITILNLLCPILVVFVLPFIKWDKQPSSSRSFPSDVIIYGDLPSWLSWFSTPDERLPGGMYEPTVRSVYKMFGRYICSWYWIGVRNCLMGMAVALGKPTTDYIPEEPGGFWKRGDIWRYSLSLGPIKFVTGYQVYKMLDGTFRAAPVFTLKRR